MALLYIILMLIAFVGYINKKYVLFLFCMLGLVSKFFMLDRTEDVMGAIKGSDIAFVLFIVLLPIVYSKNKALFSIRGDTLTRWTYIFLSFYVIELIITIIIGRESLFNSLKVIRVPFFMCGFFVLRAISIKSYQKFLKIALWITLIQSVLFFLQFIGIKLLSGERDVFENADYYITNIPTLTILFLFLLWRFEYLGEKRIFLFAFLLAVVLSSYVRGTIIAILLGFAYYTVFISRRKRRVITIILLLLVIPLSLRFINKKAEITGSVYKNFEEIEHVVNQRSNMDNINSGEGTFSLRIAMLYERIDWLMNNPQYLLTGVGTMHEDSQNTLQMFDFSLGTNNEDRFYGKTIIESGDIAWVPIAIRYGLIGIFIHIMMFFLLFNITRQRKGLLEMLSAYAIVVFLRSFDGAYFETPELIYIHTLLFAIVSRANIENKPVLM